MNIPENIRRTAARWWAQKLSGGSRFDNGASDDKNAMAGVMATMLHCAQSAKIDAEQVRKFEDALVEEMGSSRFYGTLDVDYNPGHVLTSALEGRRRCTGPAPSSSRSAHAQPPRRTTATCSAGGEVRVARAVQVGKPEGGRRGRRLRSHRRGGQGEVRGVVEIEAGRDVSGPWREVTFIEDRVGPRGGTYWCLTLSCGHFKCYRQPRFDPARDILLGPIVKMSKPWRKRRFTAPDRLRCLICKS